MVQDGSGVASKLNIIAMEFSDNHSILMTLTIHYLFNIPSSTEANQ